MENIYYFNDGVKVPNNKQGEVYLWIAKCCPKVKICSIRSGSVSHTVAIQMIQQWPLLKGWELVVSYFDQFVSNADFELLNQQVYTMRNASLKIIRVDIFLRAENAIYLLNDLLSCCNVAELKS